MSSRPSKARSFICRACGPGRRIFDPETRERFMAGALLPGSWYAKAQRFRRH